MKKSIAIVLLLLVVTLSGTSQNEKEYNPRTLLGSSDHSVRGFIGFNSKGMMLNNQLAVLGGAEVTLVFGHKLNIGFFGYGKTNQVQSNYIDSYGFRHYYELGMGGMKIEPVLFTNSLVHLTIPVQFGAGGMTLNRYQLLNYDQYPDYNTDWESGLYDFDTFVFVEPSVSAEINLLKHVRLNAGVGYCFSDAVYFAGTDVYPLNGLTGNISLRLGWF